MIFDHFLFLIDESVIKDVSDVDDFMFLSPGVSVNPSELN